MTLDQRLQMCVDVHSLEEILQVQLGDTAQLGRLVRAGLGESQLRVIFERRILVLIKRAASWRNYDLQLEVARLAARTRQLS